jgi:hypothetical protein
MNGCARRSKDDADPRVRGLRGHREKLEQMTVGIGEKRPTPQAPSRSPTARATARPRNRAARRRPRRDASAQQAPRQGSRRTQCGSGRLLVRRVAAHSPWLRSRARRHRARMSPLDRDVLAEGRRSFARFSQGCAIDWARRTASRATQSRGSRRSDSAARATKEGRRPRDGTRGPRPLCQSG